MMMRFRQRILGSVLLVFAAWGFAPSAHAQFVQQGDKLVGAGAASAQQGSSVALSAGGNTALVGGWGDDYYAGAVWVWTRSGGAWTQQGPKLVGAGAIGNAGQGVSVALSADGNTAVVGGRGDDSQGAVWVWTPSGGVWTQQGPKLVGTGSVGSAGQGGSVAVSADGNAAIVGGPYDNGSTGAVWVWTRSDGVWTQQGPKLVGTGAAGGAQQGLSVAVSADGNTALVGGSGDNGGAGAVWVWTRSGGEWTQQGPKLVGTGAVGTAGQGCSVALSADGNTALVGGRGDNGAAGAVWVWTRSGSVWAQQGPKLVGTGAVDPAFQGSVALSADGDTALVGGSEDNNLAGAVWVWTRSGTVWTQQGPKLVGTGAVGNAGQGASVALSADGGTALVGGPADNRINTLPGPAGAVWVFNRFRVAGDFDGNGVPDLVWQNDDTRQVTVWYMGGTGGAVFQGWNYLSLAGVPGWHVVAVADFNGDGVPDLVWQNDQTRQATVWYMGGADGAVFQGWNYLSAAGVPGWSIVAAADFNGDGVPDLVWQNDSTRQVTVWYMGGAGGAVFQSYIYLSVAGVPGWHIAAAADFNGDGVPDLVWQNDTTRQVLVWYMGGAAVFQGWNYLSAASVPGWHVVAAVDQNGDGVPDLVWQNDTTRQVTVWYMGGAGGAVFQGWNYLSIAGVPGWSALN